LATTRPPLFGSNTRQANAKLVLSLLADGDTIISVEVTPRSNWSDPERTLGARSRVKPMGTFLPASRAVLPTNVSTLVPTAVWARGLLRSDASGIELRRCRNALNSAGERIHARIPSVFVATDAPRSVWSDAAAENVSRLESIRI